MDGRGRNSMRLNFSNQDEESIREGVRRIGKVIEEQVALYGTLTGQEQAPRARDAAEPEGGSGEGGRVVSLPERRRRAGGS